MSPGAPTGAAAPTVYDAHGRCVQLGRSLGNGGEARVFALVSAPGSVAKVYHRVPDRAKAEKLAVMVSGAGQSLLRVAAWPTGTLHVRPGGEVAGLVMPLVERHRELHTLYNPAQRGQVFPEADWSFLLHAALNVARALAVVHAEGHVVGDVNQKNVVVGQDAVVKLLDCDSFQITANGRCFPCEVGVPDFTPPELHGQSFHRVVRTHNHDCFGLAILIFHLLFMGRHPFAGIYRKGKSDMPAERAIREGRYVYSIRAGKYEMEPPPHSLSPGVGATAEVAGLFERAFALQGTAPTRPTATEWVGALGRMERETRSCRVNRGHRYVGTFCPWCAVERSGGPDFFISLATVMAPAMGTGAAAGSFNLDNLLRRAAAIPVPPAGLTPALRNPSAKPGVPSLARPNLGHIAWVVVCYTIAVACFFGTFEYGLLFFMMFGFIGLGNLALEKAKKPKVDPGLLAAVQRSTQAHEAVCQEWVRDVETAWQKYTEAARELDARQRKYRQLPGELQKARQDLASNQRLVQLKHHLEHFYVRGATIDGVGPGLKQTLLSFGIETAADVTRGAVHSVPGFGPARTRAMLAWRQHVEAKFVYIPNKPVDPADIAALDRRFMAMRQNLEREMETLVTEMQNYSTRASGAALHLRSQIATTSEALAIAKAKAGQR